MKIRLFAALAAVAALPIAACSQAPESSANEAYAANEAGLPAEGLAVPADNVGLATDNALAPVTDNGFVPPADNALGGPVDNAAATTGNSL